jgi:hypothetical protein
MIYAPVIHDVKYTWNPKVIGWKLLLVYVCKILYAATEEYKRFNTWCLKIISNVLHAKKLEGMRPLGSILLKWIL